MTSGGPQGWPHRCLRRQSTDEEGNYPPANSITSTDLYRGYGLIASRLRLRKDLALPVIGEGYTCARVHHFDSFCVSFLVTSSEAFASTTFSLFTKRCEFAARLVFDSFYFEANTHTSLSFDLCRDFIDIKPLPITTNALTPT